MSEKFFTKKVEQEPKEIDTFKSFVGCVDVSSENAVALNIRKEANKDADIIGKVNDKDTVKVVGEDGDFYKVKASGLNGYCMKKFVK